MKKRVRILAGTVLAMSLSASAALVVDFNRAGIGGNVNARTVTTSTLFGDTWGFSDTTALISEAYGVNSTVYGGLITTWSLSKDYSPLFRFNKPNFQVQVKTGDLSDTTAKGITLWNQADFLNGADTGTLEFGNGSSLYVNLTAVVGNARDVRFVVNQGGTYYVSGTQTTANGAQAFSIADVTADTWAPISTTDYTFGAVFSELTLDDVQGVGLYYDLQRTANISSIKFNGFQADVIPEPATLGLVAAFGGGILFFRRFLQI